MPATELDKAAAACRSGDCEWCRTFRDFELPPELVAEFLSGNVVLFAGAGISTEDRLVDPVSFHMDIASELGADPADPPSFPDLMQQFVDRPNGRRELIKRIKERIDNVKAFPELRRVATRFHRALSTLFLVDTIVTTNWDDFFEIVCGASPFVTSQDFAFLDLPGRKVFKLHGSINSVGSIVATRDDYERSLKDLASGLIGAQLRLLLGTKTILYVGYSFRDDNITRVHETLRSEMGDFFPQAYAVTLDDDQEHWNRFGIIPIIADATELVEAIKSHVVEQGCLLPDDAIEEILPVQQELTQIHSALYERYDIHDCYDALYTGAYQDGMTHAFERMLARWHTGEYSHVCRVAGLVRTYEQWAAEKAEAGKWEDVAYIEGYMMGLLFLIRDKEKMAKLPMFFAFQSDEFLYDIREFDDLITEHPLPDAQRERAQEQLAKYKRGIILHHPPHLR